jgi:hypothetical protein
MLELPINTRSKEAASNNSSSEMLGRVRSLTRRPFLRPFVFGLAVEGVPVGIFLFISDIDWEGNQFFLWLMALSVLVVLLGAILGGDHRPDGLLRRSFLTSLGGLFPVLIVIWARFLWDFRFFAPSIFDVRNLSLAGRVIGPPVLLVTILGWLLALAFRFLRNRYPTTASKAEARTP